MGLVREIGLMTGIIAIMGHVVGLGWQKRVFQCIGWLPTACILAAEGMGLGWLKFGLVLFGMLWPINDIPPALLASTRILFAMSFDRVFPDWLAAVSKRSTHQ